ITPGRETPAIRAEGQRHHLTGITAQFPDLAPGRRIPDPYRAVAADGERAPVRAEEQAPGTKAQVRPGVDRLPGPRVEDVHGLIFAGPGEPRPVGAVADVVDLLTLASKDRPLPTLQVPDHHGPIRADGGQVPAVPVEGDGVHAAHVPFQHVLLI